MLVTYADATCYKQIHCYRPGLVLVAIVLLLRQQRSVPATSKILLQPAIALRVNVLWKKCQQKL